MVDSFPPTLAPAPQTIRPQYIHLFAGKIGEGLDGYFAYKGRFVGIDSAKQSYADNGYGWAQLCIFEKNTFWCVEDTGIDSTVTGWRKVNLDEPYKRT